MVRRKVINEEFKVILKFKKNAENMHLSPTAISRDLKKKLGEVEFAKILRDGNLLIKCKSEEEKNKAMQIDNICKKVVSERKIIGENKVLSLVFHLKKIWKNLKEIFMMMKYAI